MTFSANRRNGIREINALVTVTRQTGPNHRNAIELSGWARNDAGTVEADPEGVKGEVKRARGPIVVFGVSVACLIGALAIEGWPKESAETLLSVWLASLLASAVSLFSRFRKSEGVERQQLKWLALGGIFTAAAFVFSGLSEGVAGFTAGISAAIGQGLVTFGIVLLPVTIGVSILRYRLYDIDALINRALVYGSLTVALAGAYVGLVFGFQTLLAPFTAESDLAIAASTLGVAALFRPVRSRMQDFIDRRFYRRKFDAEQTVAQFSVHLRNEVELAAVTSQLTDVVQETMEPSHVSLWMRPVVER